MRQLFDRRQVLLGIAGTVLAGCAGGGAEIIPEGAAYAPWRDGPAGEAAGPRAIVRAAILAANAHDTQPWLFGLEAGGIALYADPRRNLGAMDPARRELHLSLGCALENLCLAAAEQGMVLRVTAEPGDVRAAIGATAPRRVARISFAPAEAAPSSWFAAIPHRHTNRGAYRADRPVAPERLARLAAIAAEVPTARLVLLTEPGTRRDFAAATVAATEAIIGDPAMIADSDAWFRGSPAEIAAHRDGPTIDAAGLSPTMRLFAKLLPPPSPERAHGFWLAQTRDVQVASAAGFGLILVPDLYDVPQALAAGRLWQRLHLEATRQGLAMQPLNQLPERVDRERERGQSAATARLLAALAGMPGWQATFAFRFGWPVRAAFASPRRDVAAVMLS
jgi:nitroreductase